MRVLAVLTISAATLLLPQIVAADPAQPETAPAATAAQPAAPAATSTPATAPAAPQVTTATPQQIAQTPAAASESNGDEIVCKITPPTTGTRLGGGRECHSARDWENREKEAQKATRDTQMKGLQPARLPGG